MGGGWSGQQSFQEHFVNVAAKPFFAVDFHNWYAYVVSFAEGRVGIDIDQPRRYAVPAENRKRLIAQGATAAGVKGDARHRDHESEDTGPYNWREMCLQSRGVC